MSQESNVENLVGVETHASSFMPLEYRHWNIYFIKRPPGPNILMTSASAIIWEGDLS